MFTVVIPARFASQRLPGKPLRTIAGKPMVQWVHERAVASGAQRVWIATDDPRIEKAGRAFGANVQLTSADHQSGTDRIAELARALKWAATDVVVNVQGDEPLLPPALIRQVASLLQSSPQAGVATLATPIRSLQEFLDPNVVKVAAAADGRALYFSRAPVPWHREGVREVAQTRYDGSLRHVGLYAYRVSALDRLSRLAPTFLEVTEKLEQLRALENGIAIAVAVACELPGRGVDTEEDLQAVESELASSAKRN
jgi:3-deoxy-manno-octulosonate cytidylyltransferase (CMP-KDO synthetase)